MKSYKVKFKYMFFIDKKELICFNHDEFYEGRAF